MTTTESKTACRLHTVPDSTLVVAPHRITVLPGPQGAGQTGDFNKKRPGAGDRGGPAAPTGTRAGMPVIQSSIMMNGRRGLAQMCCQAHLRSGHHIRTCFVALALHIVLLGSQTSAGSRGAHISLQNHGASADPFQLYFEEMPSVLLPCN